MQSTSPAQSAALDAGRVPEPEQVRPDVWSIPISMGSTYVPYTLTGVIRGADGKLHVIDPGIDTDENWATLEAGFTGFGLSLDDVVSTTSTHAHPDHLGLGGRLRERSGAQVVMHRLEEASLGEPRVDRSAALVAEKYAGWGAPPGAADDYHEPGHRLGVPSLEGFRADRVVEDGDLLEIEGRHVQVLHTPGHTSGSICLRDLDDNLLFTGDHVLPTINPGIGLGGVTAVNPLAGYLAALERVAVFADDEVWPGHFFRFRGIAERTAQIAQHQLKRAAEVRAVLDREPDASVWRIAQQLSWTNGWDGLESFLRVSALMQTEMFVGYVS
jgi:glyoxylase-like metal-dependent hydrolase (beta-lactamase superfamily II)